MRLAKGLSIGLCVGLVTVSQVAAAQVSQPGDRDPGGRLQELLGHTDVSTNDDLHPRLEPRGLGVRSPADRLGDE